jgi:hypothetical protein
MATISDPNFFQFADTTQISTTNQLGLRNRLINGNPLINQRVVSGSVVLAAGAYGHDRWKAGAGGCSYTFATALNVTTITISAGTLQQVIEGINLQSGTHVLSWVGTSTARIDAGAYSASGVTGTAVGGTNQTIEFGIGTFTKAQYEQASIASSFEVRPYGVELALCQRYTWRQTATAVNALSKISSGFTSNISTAFFAQIKMPVTMRATPVLTVSNQTGFSAFDGNAYFSSSAITLNSGSPDICEVSVTIAASIAYRPHALATYNANAVAEWIQFTAEL